MGRSRRRARRPSGPLYVNAVHEAAHSVAALVLGRALHGVTIKPRGRFLALTTLGACPRRFRPGRLARHARLAERQIIVALAGHEAERRIAGWHGAGGHRDDLDQAYDLADAITGRGAFSLVEADARVQLGRIQARRLVWRHRRAIRLVAEALLVEKAISGRRVREIVRRVERAPKARTRN